MKTVKRTYCCGCDARKAFTLVELLVVVAILAVVTGAVGACLAAGIRVWETAATLGKRDRDISGALESVRRDLVNVSPFPGVPFEGTPLKVSFPAPVRDIASDGGSQPEWCWQYGHPGKVEFYLDGNAWTLCRRRSRIAREGVEGPEVEVIARDIGGIVFSYGVLKEGSVDWQDNWNHPTNVPCAVKVLLVPAGAAARAGSGITVVLSAVVEEDDGKEKR